MSIMKNIKTKDPRFIDVLERFKQELDEFVYYSNLRSKLSGNVKKTSNKAYSYRNFLVRIIIEIENMDKETIIDLNTFNTFEKLNKIRTRSDFKKINDQANRFFSAALSEFERFLHHNQYIVELEIEDRVEQEIINNENKKVNVDIISLIKSPQPKKEMLKYKANYVYPRNINEAQYAKESANWTCEVDEKHLTFTAKSGKPYVETHHLIPMAFQNQYNCTIDFADNLVALCPTCHRLVHHATVEEKKEIISKLFQSRKSKYPSHGINITFGELLSYYE